MPLPGWLAALSLCCESLLLLWGGAGGSLRPSEAILCAPKLGGLIVVICLLQPALLMHDTHDDDHILEGLQPGLQAVRAWCVWLHLATLLTAELRATALQGRDG